MGLKCHPHLLRLFTLWVLAGLASCGPAKPQHTDNGSRNYLRFAKDNSELKVGSEFLTTPENWIEFHTLRSNGSQSFRFTYKAVKKGSLILSKVSSGFGYGCSGSDGSGDFTLSYEYYLRDKATSLFTEKIQANKSKGFSSEPLLSEVALEEGDEVQLKVLIKSAISCDSAHVLIYAIYK